MLLKNKSKLPRWGHQAKEFQVGREKRARAFIWPMRSGKSRGCIDVACYQFQRKNPKKLVEGVIVIAPNGVHLNWQRNEIPTWGHAQMRHHTFAWETVKRGTPEKELQWDRFIATPRPDTLRWFCVPMDALRREDCRRALRQFRESCHKNFMLIISEAHHFGRAGSKRTFKARNLGIHANFIRWETGTPILTGPLRAYSQYDILAPGALGFGNYKDFEKHFAVMVPKGRPGRGQRMAVDHYINLDELTRKIAEWTSLVLRSELKGMPKVLPPIERPIVMNEPQRQAYLTMVAKHLAEVEGTEMSVPDAGPRMMKLQQILHGWVMDTKTGKILTVDDDAPIYEAAIEEIEGTYPGKALVWCRYKEDCRRLAKKLRKRGKNVLEYWGDFTVEQREANRRKFLEPDDDSVMIGTPDCGGEGLDFSTATCVIFFSMPPNARLAAQAAERATVMDGKSISLVRLRHYGTVDDRIWSIIDGNISLADTVTGTGLRKVLEETDV
jgi:hypothetical protein